MRLHNQRQNLLATTMLESRAQSHVQSVNASNQCGWRTATSTVRCVLWRCRSTVSFSHLWLGWFLLGILWTAGGPSFEADLLCSPCCRRWERPVVDTSAIPQYAATRQLAAVQPRKHCRVHARAWCLKLIGQVSVIMVSMILESILASGSIHAVQVQVLVQQPLQCDEPDLLRQLFPSQSKAATIAKGSQDACWTCRPGSHRAVLGTGAPGCRPCELAAV